MIIRTLSIILLILAPLVSLADAGTARIITSVAKPVQCISPISVYNIDGELVRKNEMGFDLEAGKHSLIGTATVSGENCGLMRTGSAIDVPALEYDFKAGNTYYIGLEHKSANQQQWRFKVWRVVEPKEKK